MFALAWLLLPDLPEYRTGLIIVGLARCIAMVLIWNDLACGDREAAAILVAINAVFQIVAFAVLGYFYLEVLPGWLGLDQAALDVSVWEHRQVRPGLPRHPAAGRLPHPHPRRARQGPRVVREHVPAPDRPGRPVRAAVHHRPAVRPPGRHHHQPAARRRPHRGPAAGLLRAHVGRLHAADQGARVRLRARDRRVVHRGRATTSSSPSPWPSASSASPPARRWPASSGRSSRCPPSSRLVYVSLWARKFYRERTTTPDATSTSAGATR